MGLDWGFIAFLALVNPGQADLLSVVDAETALVSLGEPTGLPALRDLARGGAVGPAALSEEEAKKAERWIQNLASAVPAVREKAEGALAGLGAAIVPRLREVARTDPRCAEAAKAVLARIEAEEAACAASGGVRRLLAIRLLGEKKDEEALPILVACASDADPFVRIYAEEARARIEGGASKASSEDDPAFQRTLDSLPADTHALVVFRRPREGARVDPLAKSADTLKAAGTSPDEVRRRMAEQGLRMAAIFGNLRIDVAAFVVTGTPDPERGAAAGDPATGSGSFTVILGGLWNREAIIAGILKESSGREKRIEIEGFPGCTLGGGDGQIVFPSDRLALISIATDRFPSALPTFLANFRAKKTALPSDSPMAQFIGGSAQAPGLHGFLVKARTMLGPILAEGLREDDGDPKARSALSALQDLDSAELQFRPRAKGIRLSSEASFRKPASAKMLADFLAAKLAESQAELHDAAAEAPEDSRPRVRKWAKFLDSVEIRASGAGMTIRVQSDEMDLLDLLVGGFLAAMQSNF